MISEGSCDTEDWSNDAENLVKTVYKLPNYCVYTFVIRKAQTNRLMTCFVHHV